MKHATLLGLFLDLSAGSAFGKTDGSELLGNYVGQLPGGYEVTAEVTTASPDQGENAVVVMIKGQSFSHGVVAHYFEGTPEEPRDEYRGTFVLNPMDACDWNDCFDVHVLEVKVKWAGKAQPLLKYSMRGFQNMGVDHTKDEWVTELGNLYMDREDPVDFEAFDHADRLPDVVQRGVNYQIARYCGPDKFRAIYVTLPFPGDTEVYTVGFQNMGKGHIGEAEYTLDSHGVQNVDFQCRK